MIRVAGIDGGGTKTVCAVCDEQGTLLGLGRAGASKLQDVGPIETQATLQRALNRALTEASIDATQLDALCVGAAGMDTEADQRSFQNIVSRIIPPELSVRIETDGLVGLYSGTFGAPGVAIVAGTGVLVVGLNAAGETGRVSGWGYLFADEGSAFYIGHQALLATLHALDGRGTQTALTQAVIEQLNIRNIGEMPARFYALNFPETAMAELAPMVTGVAEAGDAVASRILQEAGKQLALTARAQIEQLRLDEEERIVVVLIGSVFCSSIVRSTAEEELRSAYPRVAFIRPDWEPVAGAIALALEHARVQLNKLIVKRLRQQFQTKGEVWRSGSTH